MKIGFIGCGNMGSAIMHGMLSGGICTPEDIMASAAHSATLEKKKEELGILVTLDNREAAAFAEILFLAVKPQYYPQVIEEIRDTVSEDQIIISLAPGKTMAWLAEQFGKQLKLVRTMPNTPAMVGEGMTGICASEQVTGAELKLICDIFDSFGKSEIVTEGLMDAVVGVSGSSPAYVFMFIEAMADAAVADGMPRSQAYKFAAQAVLGSAKMVLETGKHPGELKDMVCSPGGTTIEAVRVLEEKGMRSAVIEAMKACVKKSRGM